MRSLCLLCLFLTGLSFSSHAQQVDSARISPATIDPDNKIFEKAEEEAMVNAALWRSHLERHLVPVIEAAANAGMKAGKYQVNVRFIVEKDGSISDVKALNDPGFGLALGAVNVVKTGPSWSPARQNGQIVRSYHTQPITFSIQEETRRTDVKRKW